MEEESGYGRRLSQLYRILILSLNQSVYLLSFPSVCEETHVMFPLNMFHVRSGKCTPVFKLNREVFLCLLRRKQKCQSHILRFLLHFQFSLWLSELISTCVMECYKWFGNIRTMDHWFINNTSFFFRNYENVELKVIK